MQIREARFEECRTPRDDEFTVILGNIASPKDAGLVAGRILEVVSRPVVVDGRELSIPTSIGISLYPSDGNDAETLVMNADTAMYRAKEHGRNNYQFRTEELNTAALERMTSEASLRKRPSNRATALLNTAFALGIMAGVIMGLPSYLVTTSDIEHL